MLESLYFAGVIIMPRVLEFCSSAALIAFIVKYGFPLVHDYEVADAVKHLTYLVLCLGIVIVTLQAVQLKRR
jgi:hypothetical protein